MKNRTNAMLAALIAANALWIADARAEDSKGSLTLALENDLFGAGTDKHYTHGTEITYVSDTYHSEWLSNFSALFPFTEIMRTREFETQPDTDEYGAIAISYRF